MSPESKVPRRWSWLRLMGQLLVLLLVGVAVWLLVEGQRQNNAVRAALAELDASDPDWRLDALEATRADVPDHENGARLIVAAKGALPRHWPLRDEIGERLERLRPSERLPEGLLARLEAEMPRQAGPALGASRGLSLRSRGRFPITYARVAIATLLPDVQHCRDLCSLWRLEALRRAEKGEGDRAMIATRAALNAGRAVGDEPFAVSQLVRIACVIQAVQTAERVLGLSEPGAAELERLQQLAEDELRFDGYRVVMRGERAVMYSTYLALVRGEIGLHQLSDPGGRRPMTAPLLNWYGRGLARKDFPQALAYYNRFVALADLPGPEQAAREREAMSEIRALPASAVLTRTLVPALEKLGGAFRRKQALVQALAVAVALERYRRDHRRWPAEVKSLVPKYLKEVPTDPADGLPMRYRLEKGSVVVYSIGPDGVDNGGNVHASPAAPGGDVGLRLYNAEQRRRPAPEGHEADKAR